MVVLVGDDVLVGVGVHEPAVPVRVRVDQVDGQQQLGVAEDALRPAVGDQAVLLGEHEHAVRQVRQQREVVRGGDEREAASVERLQDLEQQRLAARVEAGGRLVQEQDGGREHEQRGERDPLLLAGAQTGRGAPAQPGDLEQREGVLDAPQHLVLRPPHLQRAERELVLDGGAEQLGVGALEQEPDLLPEPRPERRRGRARPR